MIETKEEMAPPFGRCMPKKKYYIPLIGLLFFYAFFQNLHHNDNEGDQSKEREKGTTFQYEATTTASIITKALRQKALSQNLTEVTNCTKQLPKSIVIGAAKCGTSALLNFLNQHPEIVTVSPYRELQYFSNPSSFMKGPGWYKNNMPCSAPGQITMEKSPQYSWSAMAPKRMLAFDKDLKMIFIACNPVKRLMSMLAQSLYLLKKRENDTSVGIDNLTLPLNKNRNITMMKTLNQYARFPPNRRARQHVGKKNVTFESLAINQITGEVNRKWKELKKGFYGYQMKPYLKYFNRSQIHVVNGEDFLKDPLNELGKVETFLGIESWYEHQELTNRNDDFYCLNDKCLTGEKGRKHPYVDPVILDKLSQYYKPYNEEFYNVMNVTFNWENEYKLDPNAPRNASKSSANYIKTKGHQTF